MRPEDISHRMPHPHVPNLDRVVPPSGQKDLRCDTTRGSAMGSRISSMRQIGKQEAELGLVGFGPGARRRAKDKKQMEDDNALYTPWTSRHDRAHHLILSGEPTLNV